MSEKYYREINSNKDIVKFKLQLGTILLKLNEHNSNISNIKDDITKLNTDIKNNDKDIKSNYDMCVNNSSSIRDVDRKIYAANTDIESINTKLKKYRYTISSMWIDYLNLKTDYNIKNTSYTLIDYIFYDEFIGGSYLEISCNILYKYDNYNYIGLLKHHYKILDDNDKVIQEHIIVHSNSGDNAVNHLSMNDSFTILFITKPTYKLKLNLTINKLDSNNMTSVKFKILNPNYHNVLKLKHIKYML